MSIEPNSKFDIQHSAFDILYFGREPEWVFTFALRSLGIACLPTGRLHAFPRAGAAVRNDVALQ